MDIKTKWLVKEKAPHSFITMQKEVPPQLESEDTREGWEWRSEGGKHSFKYLSVKKQVVQRGELSPPLAKFPSAPLPYTTIWRHSLLVPFFSLSLICTFSLMVFGPCSCVGYGVHYALCACFLVPVKQYHHHLVPRSPFIFLLFLICLPQNTLLLGLAIRPT